MEVKKTPGDDPAEILFNNYILKELCYPDTRSNSFKKIVEI